MLFFLLYIYRERDRFLRGSIAEELALDRDHAVLDEVNSNGDLPRHRRGGRGGGVGVRGEVGRHVRLLVRSDLPETWFESADRDLIFQASFERNWAGQ